MVREEAVGNVLQAQTEIQLEHRGYDKATVVKAPLGKTCRVARDAAAIRRKDDHPDWSAVQVNEAAEQAATEHVYQALMAGDLRQSTDGETYPAYFGERWDNANHKA